MTGALIYARASLIHPDAGAAAPMHQRGKVDPPCQKQDEPNRRQQPTTARPPEGDIHTRCSDATCDPHERERSGAAYPVLPHPESRTQTEPQARWMRLGAGCGLRQSGRGGVAGQTGMSVLTGRNMIDIRGCHDGEVDNSSHAISRGFGSAVSRVTNND